MKSRKRDGSTRTHETTPAAADVTRGATPIGKRELCAALNWSRPRLDRRLDTDRNFPVAQRGDRCYPWQFDLAAVLRYLGHVDGDPTARHPRSGASGALRSAQHTGEATERQRRVAAEAEMLEDKLRTSRAELVDTEEMHRVVETLLERFKVHFDAQPVAIVERLSLPADATEPIRAMFDELLETAHNDVRRLLKPVELP